LRSTSTAGRALRHLEQVGAVERDPVHRRLGRVNGRFASCAPRIELFITELSILESRGNLELLRSALAWAPDSEAIGFLHREGAARAALLGAYEHARDRLIAAGAALDPEAGEAVGSSPGQIAARHRLVGGWQPYCLYSTIIRHYARRLTSAMGELGLAHLEPVYITEVDVYDLTTRLDRSVAATYLRQEPSSARHLAAQLCDLLDTVTARIGTVLAPTDLDIRCTRYPTTA
jgi:hypothetical protein